MPPSNVNRTEAQIYPSMRNVTQLRCQLFFAVGIEVNSRRDSALVAVGPYDGMLRHWPVCLIPSFQVVIADLVWS